MMQAAVKIMQKKYPEPPGTVSEELKTFLNYCLKPDPNQRASATQLIKTDFISNIGRIEISH